MSQSTITSEPNTFTSTITLQTPPPSSRTTTTLLKQCLKKAMTNMRVRRKRQSLCVWKSIWTLTKLIMKKKRPKIKSLEGAARKVKKRFGRLEGFQLYHQHGSMRCSAILKHVMTARHSAPLASLPIEVRLTTFNCFSMMIFLTCWCKIQTSILLVKMLEVMGLGPGSPPQFQR